MSIEKKPSIYDLFNRMAECDRDIRLGLFADNLLNMQATKKGTRLTVGVAGNVLSAIMSGELTGCVVLWNPAQAKELLDEMENKKDEQAGHA
jgi:hypothetical protein